MSILTNGAKHGYEGVKAVLNMAEKNLEKVMTWSASQRETNWLAKGISSGAPCLRSLATRMAKLPARIAFGSNVFFVAEVYAMAKCVSICLGALDKLLRKAYLKIDTIQDKEIVCASLKSVIKFVRFVLSAIKFVADLPVGMVEFVLKPLVWIVTKIIVRVDMCLTKQNLAETHDIFDEIQLMEQSLAATEKILNDMNIHYHSLEIVSQKDSHSSSRLRRLLCRLRHRFCCHLIKKMMPNTDLSLNDFSLNELHRLGDILIIKALIGRAMLLNFHQVKYAIQESKRAFTSGNFKALNEIASNCGLGEQQTMELEKVILSTSEEVLWLQQKVGSAQLKVNESQRKLAVAQEKIDAARAVEEAKTDLNRAQVGHPGRCNITKAQQKLEAAQKRLATAIANDQRQGSRSLDNLEQNLKESIGELNNSLLAYALEKSEVKNLSPIWKAWERTKARSKQINSMLAALGTNSPTQSIDANLLAVTIKEIREENEKELASLEQCRCSHVFQHFFQYLCGKFTTQTR